jgi:hypothetical protein
MPALLAFDFINLCVSHLMLRFPRTRYQPAALLGPRMSHKTHALNAMNPKITVSANIPSHIAAPAPIGP